MFIFITFSCSCFFLLFEIVTQTLMRMQKNSLRLVSKLCWWDILQLIASALLTSQYIDCDSEVTQNGRCWKQRRLTSTADQALKKTKKQTHLKQLYTKIHTHMWCETNAPGLFILFHFPSIRTADVKNYMPAAIHVAAVSIWSLPKNTQVHKKTRARKHKYTPW